jgi:hypothetical protein
MRTSCFFLPPAEFEQSVQSVVGRDRWFSGDPVRPFRDDAPLFKGYQRLITDWLTGGDTGQVQPGTPRCGAAGTLTRELKLGRRQGTA